MFDVALFDWQPLLAASGLSAAALSLLLYRRCACRLRALESSLDTRIDELAGAVGAMCCAASAAGDRLISVERRSEVLQLRQDELAPRQQRPKQFRQAVALLDRGASTDELMEVCGIARGEAELVSYLHHSQGS